MFKIILYREKGIVYYRTPSGEWVQANFYQDAYHIPFPASTQIDNKTGEQILYLSRTENEIVFKLIYQSPSIAYSGGRGGGSGISKINVQNQGITIGKKSTFNFKGAGVTAENVGNGQVDITIPSAECAIDVTYAELIALIGANGLGVGCFYRITDFQTVHIIPNTAILHVGTIEPIIVQANTTNSIHAEAISTIFDGEEILYEVVDSTTSGGTKGRIYYRRDTIKNNATGYDWRSVIFRRWDDGSGNFTSLTDNGNASQDYYTFNEPYIGQLFGTAPFCFGNELGAITDIGINGFGAPSDKLNNIVFLLNGINIGDVVSAMIDNVFSQDCWNNTIIANLIGANRIKTLFV